MPVEIVQILATRTAEEKAAILLKWNFIAAKLCVCRRCGRTSNFFLIQKLNSWFINSYQISRISWISEISEALKFTFRPRISSQPYQVTTVKRIQCSSEAPTWLSRFSTRWSEECVIHYLIYDSRLGFNIDTMLIDKASCLTSKILP